MRPNSIADRAPIWQPNTSFKLVVAALLAIVMMILPSGVGIVSAEQTVTWQRFDVTLDLQADGSYHVTERQVIRFEGGTFSGGFAVLPLDRIDGIDNIQLSEEIGGNDEPYQLIAWSRYDDDAETYSYRETGSEIEIAWGFPSTRNGTRTFVLEYDVAGALRVYGTGADARQQIWWTAISGDVTSAGAVEDATVTINLPEPIELSTALLGDDAEKIAADHTDDGQSWIWTKSNLGEGDDFLVRLEFPALVDAETPTWQQVDDSRRLDEEKSADRQAFYDLVFMGIGILFTVAGIAGIYGLWYAKGRDPHVGLVAEFLPEPPDDLPAGAVGALLDEVANERDIVATIVDFGRRGVIRIDEGSEDNARSTYGARDFTFTLLDASIAATQFEQSVLSSLFGLTLETGQSVQLSRARSGFAAGAETIKTNMYAELVKRGYFTRSPEQTRSRWRSGAFVSLIVFAILACVSIGFIRDVSWFIYFPVAVVAVSILVIALLSRVLPKKTLPGAEAAAKWRSFEKYLKDIEKYDKLSESQQIFDKYLPYAVAFGLEEGWVRKFSTAGASPPAWYGPVILSGPRDWTERPQTQRNYGGGGTIWNVPSGGGGSTGGGGFSIPGMQEMSDNAGKSIQGGSNSFFDMLSAAGRAFSDYSSSSSSSSSSRRHWGGTSGRSGGGGFSGGGRRGGSSGGGRRGFH